MTAPTATFLREPAEGMALVVRTCDAQMRSYQGFTWPTSGPVTAPDWSPAASCGRGLHGLLWGEGDGGLLNWAEDARWLLVEVDPTTCIDLGGKVKYPAGEVLFVGERTAAIELLLTHPVAADKAIVGRTSTSGDGGTSTSGYGGTSTSGDGGTSTSGYGGTSTSGYGGTSTSGDGGTSTSGDGGTSTSGYGGTSTSGDGGTSTSGDRGTVRAAKDGMLVLHWYDAKLGRYRIRSVDVGIDGIKPDTDYKLSEDGQTWVEVAPEPDAGASSIKGLARA